jgi:HAD superfamily hydrolase (TIGR01490 family)
VSGKERVAAFFDLDGTLLPLPSLEKRFLRRLQYRRRIGAPNCLAWLAEAARLLPQGINRVLYANKAYLRGVRAEETASLTIPAFFPAALQRVGWHSSRGHALVIVSGTLEPLARMAAAALEAEPTQRGVSASIGVIATRLEQLAEQWTGRILGQAMFGDAKARAIAAFCAAQEIELARCFAYGDSVHDRAMLECVGQPFAVNPSDDLRRIAERNQWPVLQWGQRTISARPHFSSLRSMRTLR